jgi:HSP90 family molecular chaperone
VVTRRVLKFIEDEMKRDPVAYDKWYQQFQIFLKEGVLSDHENQEQLLRLMRYHSSKTSGSVSLEEYVKSMKEGQKKIYYLSGASPEEADSNPFMEPFKDSEVPVLIIGNQVDEMVF